MKKRLLFFMVLLLGICAAVPASAEEKKITLTAVCNDDGSITFTGSATADTLFVGDMVCVYKEGSEPEDGPIFFYYLSGDSEFSLTHPHLSCRATNRNGDFIDIENLTLKPGKYFAVVVASQSGKGTVFSNRTYFTVTAVAASPTAEIPAEPEEKITLTAVCNDDGSITFTGSTTAHSFLVGDMVCVYKEGDEPDGGEYVSPIFYYYISGDTEFSLTHPHLYCRATYRSDDFIDKENLSLKPGKYFAIIKGERSGSGIGFVFYPVSFNRAYFTVTAVAASPTAEITPEPVTPTPEVTPLPSEPRISAAPTASEKAAPTQTVPPAPDDSSQSGSDFLPIILCVVLGILFCIELAVIISVLKKKKG